MKCIGTNQGCLIRVNLKDSNKPVTKMELHRKKINQMYMQQGTAVFSVSDDGLLRMTKMLDELDNFYIDTKEYYP